MSLECESVTTICILARRTLPVVWQDSAKISQFRFCFSRLRLLVML
uniref:Uncharacterized protein n=1 Tax=Arundo donax TaxID=35708 RepID=A0A0A8YSP0_ARUDO